MSMDIYAEPGTPVIFTGCSKEQQSGTYGSCSYADHSVLVENAIYIIHHTEVLPWSTKVYLVDEFRVLGPFNSVCFEEVSG